MHVPFLTSVKLKHSVQASPLQPLKRRRSHRVPLPPRCLALLRSMPQTHTGVPPLRPQAVGDRPVGDHAQFASRFRTARAEIVIRRLGDDDWGAHEVSEHQLAHLVGNATTRSYKSDDPLEQQRVLMTR
jgi:integrase